MWNVTQLLTVTSLFVVFLYAEARGQQESFLQIGDPVPEFCCLDQQGHVWDSSDHFGKGIRVIYFYPADFAFCSARQAQRYRDSQRELAAFGAEVIGVSGDGVESHHLFSDTHSLNFALLSDADGGIARQFGVPIRAGGKAMPADASGKPLIGPNGNVVQFPRDFTAARWTFIIDPDGHVIYREMDVAPRTDTKEVLQFLRERKASQDF